MTKSKTKSKKKEEPPTLPEYDGPDELPARKPDPDVHPTCWKDGEKCRPGSWFEACRNCGGSDNQYPRY